MNATPPPEIDGDRLDALMQLALAPFLREGKPFDSHALIAALAQQRQHAYIDLLFAFAPRSATPFGTLHAEMRRRIKVLATAAGFTAEESSSKDLWQQNSSCVKYTLST
jgi:hypothetical protein